MGEGDVISCLLSEMIVEQAFSSFPYLMIFQSGVHDMHDPLPRYKGEAKVAIGVILDLVLVISFKVPKFMKDYGNFLKCVSIQKIFY